MPGCSSPLLTASRVDRCTMLLTRVPRWCRWPPVPPPPPPPPPPPIADRMLAGEPETSDGTLSFSAYKLGTDPLRDTRRLWLSLGRRQSASIGSGTMASGNLDIMRILFAYIDG
uniref:Uncharacterized protein n=1 Tax=Anopheles farauti TaxID=69004 RepID=A0A182QR85_9DIPT